MAKYYSLRSFRYYVGTFKVAFLAVALVFLVASALLAIIPWLIGGLTASLAHGSAQSSTLWWVAVLVLASVGHDTLWHLGDFLYLRLLNTRSQHYDDIVFQAVIDQPYSYFVDKFTGKISSYTNSLGREFRDFLDQFCRSYLSLLVQIPITAAIMFSVNVPTGLIFAISLVCMWIIGSKLAGLASAAEHTQADARSSMDGYIVDTIANFASVKSFANEAREVMAIRHKRTSVITAAHRSQITDIFFWTAMSFFVRWIIWPSTIILNTYLFLHHAISLGQLNTLLSAVLIFSNFIWEVIWQGSQLMMRVARTEEAYRYLFGPRDIPTVPASFPQPTPPAFTEQIDLRHVSFAYPDKPDVPVLSDLSLVIAHGERIGIVGHSGGGKTTLTKLLLGYYPITDGGLYVDGQSVGTAALACLVAYVPQDTAIFHRSIRDNIAYARPDASDELIVAAAHHAQAHEFISVLPQGYDTLVGERGVKLSGGQRQRIAIARAILKDAPLLVLDEATSALDSASERLVQTALWELMKGRTAIVIAHRLSTIQKMDRIVVLDHGTIAEEGTHKELLARKGVYATLWTHQSGGFIEE